MLKKSILVEPECLNPLHAEIAHPFIELFRRVFALFEMGRPVSQAVYNRDPAAGIKVAYQALQVKRLIRYVGEGIADQDKVHRFRKLGIQVIPENRFNIIQIAAFGKFFDVSQKFLLNIHGINPCRPGPYSSGPSVW